MVRVAVLFALLATNTAFAQVEVTTEEFRTIRKMKVSDWRKVMLFDESKQKWTERFISGTLPSGELVLEGRTFSVKDKIPPDTVYATHMLDNVTPVIAAVRLQAMSEVFVGTEEPGSYTRYLLRFIFPDGAMGLGPWGQGDLIRVSENFAVSELCAHSKLADVHVGDRIKIDGKAHTVQGIFDNDDFLATPYPPRVKSTVDTLRDATRVTPNSGYEMDQPSGLCLADRLF